MKNGFLSFLSSLVLALSLSSALQAAPIDQDPSSGGVTLREDDVIKIGGITEHWKLIWQSQPSLICVPEGDDAMDWYTCPCMGYAFGERGALDLIRTQPGKDDEIFHLTPLFTDSEVPADGQAALQRWPVQDDDNKWYDDAPDDVMDQIRKRESVKAMEFADYNHDGRATEFLLQVNVAPCGKSYNVLIGVTPSNAKLHVFGTAEHPDKPLILIRRIWEELLASKGGDVTSIEWTCGDHGSEVQQEVHLHTDAVGIHATELTYECDENSERGTLKSTEAL